jgi:hypothetical protein
MEVKKTKKMLLSSSFPNMSSDIFGTKVMAVLVNIVFSILSIFQVKLPTKYQKKIKNKK